MSVNKFTTLKISVTPSFDEWVVFKLIFMFCSAMHVYTDRSTDMSIIVIRSPLAEV